MNEETKNLISLLLTDTDPDVRRRAAEDLAECKDLNVLAVLSIALQDENKGVEDAVSRSFLSIGGVAAARAIVYHIEDENITSRNLAAKLLIKLGENSIHALVPYLRSHNKDIRKLAVDILGEIKSKEPVYYLLPLLNDTDPNVITAAVEALGNIGSSTAIDPISETYKRYSFARIVAIEALGKIGGDSVRDFLENKFEEALNVGNADGLYLFALLDAIGIVGDSKTLKILIANYEKFKEHLRDVLLHEVVQIIERCNLEFQFEDKVKGDLLHALHSDNKHIQLSAAKGLIQFKDRDVTRALILSFGISEEMDFVIIAQMSARPQVFQIIVECLVGEVARGKIQMIMLIGKLATEFVHAFKSFDDYPIDDNNLKRAFTIVQNAWQDASQEDLEIIADTLFRLDSNRTVEFLNSVIAELDPWSRVHMIDQLAAISTQPALDCIARLAYDENEMVQEAAITVLQAAGLPIGIGMPITRSESLDKGVNEGV